MEKIVTLSEEQLNKKDLANVTSEENRMVVKCMLHWTKKWIYTCLQTKQMYSKFRARYLN